MRVAIASFLALTVAAFATAAPANEPPVMVGGYRSVPTTPDLEELLYSALRNETSYGEDVHARVCATNVTSVEQQVVAGMNRRFTTRACDVRKTLLLQSDVSPTDDDVTAHLGNCSAAFARNCVAVDAVVVVYTSLTNATSVSSIDVSSTKPTRADTVVVHVHAKQA